MVLRALRHGLLALGVALACVPAASAAAPPDLNPRPAEFPGVAVDKDVAITMRDGVRIYADVRRPAGKDGKAAPGRFPVVLTQTPYNKANSAGSGQLADLAGVNDLLPTRGYVQVIVDVRGTGGSEGAWDSFGAAEQADSLEIANWATSQPWSNGRLALYGASYMAINQFFTAAQHPKGLKALFPVIPAEDVYRDVTWHGGAVDSGFIPLWLGIVSATKQIPPRLQRVGPGRNDALPRRPRVRGAQLPDHRAGRNARQRARLRRAVLQAALARLGGVAGEGAHVHHGRLVRPLPARRAAAVPRAQAQARPQATHDGPLVPRHRRRRIGGEGAPPGSRSCRSRGSTAG